MYMYTSYIPDFLIYKENVSLKGVLFSKKKIFMQVLSAEITCCKTGRKHYSFLFFMLAYIKNLSAHMYPPTNQSSAVYPPESTCTYRRVFIGHWW